MRLLFLLHNLSVGGVTTVLLNRLNFLVNKYDYEVFIFVEKEVDEEITQKFDCKIIILQMNQNVFQNLPKLPFYSYYILTKRTKTEITTTIEKIRPHCVIDTGWGIYTLVTPFLKNVKKIREYHESFRSRKYIKAYRGLNLFDRIRTFFARSIENKYDFTITLSHKDALHRNYLNKFPIIIPNPITRHDTNVINVKKNIILGVGLLSSLKNFKDQILICNELFKKYPEWQLHIYGADGGERKNLEDMIDQYNLSNFVQLKGQSNAIKSKMSEASLLFSTSLSEGFGMVILEAQQMGCPVVAYDCDCGPSEIINDGLDGYLIPVGNRDLFYHKAKTIMSNSHLIAEMGERAKNNAAKFSVNLIAEKWNEFYKNIK